jgi:hypothetical protein
LILGIFFLSASILAFELICAQLVGFVVGTGYSLIVIAIAMLGTCFAGSWLAAAPAKNLKNECASFAVLTAILVASELATLRRFVIHKDVD